MSVRAKRGTKAQVDAAAGAGTLKEGELIYLTDEQKFAGATGTGAYAGLGGFEIGDTLATARNPGAGWLEGNGSVLAQSSYAALFAAIGLVPDAPGNGTTWAAQPVTGQLQSVAFGNGTFVTVLDFGTQRVLTSPDGVNWTPRIGAPLQRGQRVGDIAALDLVDGLAHELECFVVLASHHAALPTAATFSSRTSNPGTVRRPAETASSAMRCTSSRNRTGSRP